MAVWAGARKKGGLLPLWQRLRARHGASTPSSSGGLPLCSEARHRPGLRNRLRGSLDVGLPDLGLEERGGLGRKPAF